MINNNVINNQYSIQPTNASVPLSKETVSNSANTMPINSRIVQEPNVLKRANNNVYPNYIKKLYINNQSASHGSLTESFIRSRSSLSPTYMHNEIVVRYNMISSIPLNLNDIKKLNKIA